MSQVVKTFAVFVLFIVAVGVEGESDSSEQFASDSGSVWTVDLVRTLPDMQAEYVRSIEANWAKGRSLGHDRGVIVSYRALVASPDPDRGWDVILMTEYADSDALANREEIFKEIFMSPDFVREESAVPSSELREFIASGVVMKELVSESTR